MSKIQARSIDTPFSIKPTAYAPSRGREVRTENNRIQERDGTVIAMWWNDRENNRTEFRIQKGIRAQIDLRWHMKNRTPGFGYRVMKTGEKFEEFERMSRAALRDKEVY